MLCAEEEQSRMCWVTAVRLLKVISLQLGVSIKCWEFHQGLEIAVVQNAEIHCESVWVCEKEEEKSPPSNVCILFLSKR